jgi:Aspartyl protease
MAWLRAIRPGSFPVKKNALNIPLSFKNYLGMANYVALVDSGATENFIDTETVTKLKLGRRPLKVPLEVRNVDGTGNKAGNLTHYVKLRAKVNEKEEELTFYVTSLG